MILDDMIKCANRYRWLRKELAKGNYTYFVEVVSSEADMDEWIDGQMEKENELE